MKVAPSIAICFSIFAAAWLVASPGNEAHGQKGPPALPSGVVDGSGNLRVPADYRTAYEPLGSWSVASEKGEGAAEMHVVYASPGTIAAFRMDNEFPDGTVLVKEVFNAVTGSMTTGTVSYPKSVKGWFVMVKDKHSRHTGHPLWGDGWAWSWFDAADPLKTTSTNYKSDCLACHEPAKDRDLVYSEGYPPLH